MASDKSIGVLYADETTSGLTHDFFAAVLESFIQTIQKKGYHVSFMNSNKSHEGRKTYLEQAKEREYAGIVVACIDMRDEEVLEMFQSQIPMVTIDEEIDGVISIKSDNYNGMKELTNYIISMGHTRIAYITGDDNTVATIRFKTFMETCKENNVEIPPEYLKKGSFRDIEKMTVLTEELLRLQNPPSCIIYPDDFAAVGGFNVIRARGLDIPSDVSLAGYDGLFLMSQYEPRITTVVQDKESIGRIAGEKLMEWIENPECELENTITVPTKLEKGRSVGKTFI